jgi:hypothetical protein
MAVPVASSRLLSYRLQTTDAATFAPARAHLAEDAASGALTGTDSAGVTLTLALCAAETLRKEAA